jgi:shikimate dehydrogenase
VRQYGLLGFPLGHSFSVSYFKQKFENEGISEAVYKAFPIDNLEKLQALFQENPALMGLNVTIPYKEAIIPYLHELDKEAQIIGAVNTISIKNGIRKGFNTDIIGFEKSVDPFLNDIAHKNQVNIPSTKSLPKTKALILGTGGSAKAVKYVLEKHFIPFLSVSSRKNPESLTYEDLDEEVIKSHILIINCTPLGMFPKTEGYPKIPYSLLDSRHILFDMIYNPEETLFLKKGKEAGATIKNGLEMLHFQAEASWNIWNQ